ncbi:MAG: hypothetical protein A3H27_01575 [Acidobacteria bacterium RIFCSPLOWO2_02_FULL_59_13]|nr:MAG: hypothetical protein A3H27_01575 [Acidobacteria bacterium RIFCSPLOWO2_02_FULL_59_13]
MKRTKTNGKQFVVCTNNSDYPASLELHKIYQVLPDERAAEDDFVRVIDERGEDYLYSADRFVPVDLPQKVERSVMRTSREPPMLATNAMRPPRHGSLARPSGSPRTHRTHARRS